MQSQLGLEKNLTSKLFVPKMRLVFLHVPLNCFGKSFYCMTYFIEIGEGVKALRSVFVVVMAFGHGFCETVTGAESGRGQFGVYRAESPGFTLTHSVENMHTSARIVFDAHGFFML